MPKQNALPKPEQPDEPMTAGDVQNERIRALEHRMGLLQGALVNLLGPLKQLKKLNSLPTDAVHKAAQNAEALLSQ